MSTAELLPDNIRRIAVLVASVDSATARQLLLHLPTSIAKQVRRTLQNLGPISPAERQRILTEFQSTAAKQNRVAASQANATLDSATQSPGSTQNSVLSLNSLDRSSTTDQSNLSQTYAPSLAAGSERNGSLMYSAQSLASQEPLQPAWKQMDIGALSHFLRAERASVIAVVINQLSPELGVALLQQLPAITHRDVLQAISNLQDIDEEAMHFIEEHLRERLKDYEQQINSGAKGTRRVAALLAAAPPDLQETWSRFVHIAIDVSQVLPTETQPNATLQSAIEGNVKETKQTTTTQASQSETAKSQMGTSVVTTDVPPVASTSPMADSILHEDSYILPFPGLNNPSQLSNTDRSLIQLEFEQILSLSTHQLAQVLTSADSQTVLLALAGASPNFMNRFYAMLTKADGKALARRLSQIGPLKLRDIDEAQRSIAELAAELLSPRMQRTNHAQPLRAVA